MLKSLASLAAVSLVAGFGATHMRVADPATSVARPGCNSVVASNFTSNKYAGGTLYVTSAADPSEWTHVVDLADAAIEAGCVPKHKPHMVVPSPDGKYAVISYTGDKFVHILDAATKKIVMCVDASAPAAGVVGGAMHTVAWHGDDQLLLCDMTGSVNGVGGGAIHKFFLDWDEGSFTYGGSLAVGSTKAGRGGTSATKPISLGNNPLGQYRNLYFVTDAKGAGSIMDAETMTVARDFTLAEMAPCAGGGLWVEPHPEDPAIVIAQYGSQDAGSATPTPECLYKVDMSQLDITQTYLLPAGSDDAHGIQFCRDSAGSTFLINTNRASSMLNILDYDSGAVVGPAFDLNADFPEAYLQPDVAFLSGSTLFMAARGPAPVSAVKPQNFLETATPGVFFLELTECVNPAYGSQYRLLTDLERSVITSDVHGIWGVNDEIWVVDQAGTGSVQTYEVYSSCAAYES